MRALLIDDNPGDLYLLRAALRRASEDEVELVECTDAAEALEAIRSGEEVQFIFLDLNMPRMSGEEFLVAFSPIRIERGMDVDVYIISSSDHERDLALVERYECVSGYLLKPASPKALREVVHPQAH